jgi:hypothetical protein
VESKLGKGTTFFVTLPVQLPAQLLAEETAVSPSELNNEIEI